MRAIRARYDPYLQTRTRVDQLEQIGHNVDKVWMICSFCEIVSKLTDLTSFFQLPSRHGMQVEFIVMGGTFMSLDPGYRDFFIRNLHDALSGHTSNNVHEAVRYGCVLVFLMCFYSWAKKL